MSSATHTSLAGRLDALTVDGRVDGDRAVLVRIHHDFRPPWPVVGGLIADRVIGPYFVAAIAGKTLTTIKAIVEGESGRTPHPVRDLP